MNDFHGILVSSGHTSLSVLLQVFSAGAWRSALTRRTGHTFSNESAAARLFALADRWDPVPRSLLRFVYQQSSLRDAVQARAIPSGRSKEWDTPAHDGRVQSSEPYRSAYPLEGCPDAAWTAQRQVQGSAAPRGELRGTACLWSTQAAGSCGACWASGAPPADWPDVPACQVAAALHTQYSVDQCTCSVKNVFYTLHSVKSVLHRNVVSSVVPKPAPAEYNTY